MASSRSLLLLKLFLLLLTITRLPGEARSATQPIRVLVWGERQPQQRQAYTNWLGNQIAQHLRSVPGLQVVSTALDDPRQGLATLDQTDVLIWWGHVRQMEIEPPVAADIVQRILAGRLSLIALHSAHWSRPFVEAMNERARRDALESLPPSERAGAVLVETQLLPRPLMPPRHGERLSPTAQYRKPIEGPVRIDLILPNCCFPAYRGDGKPSQIRILKPDHPISRGVPSVFQIPQTEMYDEPFHVPPPDDVILEERWTTGEWFRSGMLWNLGKGRIFYFRPGHETYPVYFNPNVLRILGNACLWLGRAGS